jgi:hypothetical protein
VNCHPVTIAAATGRVVLELEMTWAEDFIALNTSTFDHVGIPPTLLRKVFVVPMGNFVKVFVVASPQ